MSTSSLLQVCRLYTPSTQVDASSCVYVHVRMHSSIEARSVLSVARLRTNERRGERAVPHFQSHVRDSAYRRCLSIVSPLDIYSGFGFAQRDRTEPLRASSHADAPSMRRCFRKRGLFQPPPPLSSSLAAGASNGKIEIERSHLGEVHAIESTSI